MAKNVLFIEDNMTDFNEFSGIMIKEGYTVYPQEIYDQDALTKFLWNNGLEYEQLKMNIFKYIADNELHKEISVLIFDISLFGERDGVLDKYGMTLFEDFENSFYEFYEKRKGKNPNCRKWSKNVRAIALTNFGKSRCIEYEKKYKILTVLNKDAVKGDKEYFLAKLETAMSYKSDADEVGNFFTDFTPEDLHCTEINKEVKVIVAQPALLPDDFESVTTVLWGIKETDDYKKYIDAILEKAKEHESNLVVFPELCISESFYGIFYEWTEKNKNVVVIAGSCYWKDNGNYYSIASIFFNGKRHTTEKSIASPHEIFKSRLNDSLHVRKGHQHYFENTPFGSLGILICADLFDDNGQNPSEYLKTVDLDVLAVIAFQNGSYIHRDEINSSLQTGAKIPFCIYCNSLSKITEKIIADGESALFADEYKNDIDVGIKYEYVKDGSLLKKRIEMPSGKGGALVASFDLSESVKYGNTDPNRALFNEMEKYLYKNGCLEKYIKGDN